MSYTEGHPFQRPPMPKPFSRQDYWNAKNRRIRSQKKALQAILCLPPGEPEKALFARWPEKLPKAVRKEIPSSLLAQWRAQRAVVAQKRLDEFVAQYLEMTSFIDRMDEAIEAHHVEGLELVDALLSVVGVESIAIHCAEVDFRFTPKQGWDREEILGGVCWAMEEGGGITVTQKLSLRAQVRQPDGTMAWVPQLRVYGFLCDSGQCKPVSAAQMRHTYNHTPDGEPLAPLPGVGFGNGQDLLRAARSSRAPSH